MSDDEPPKVTDEWKIIAFLMGFNVPLESKRVRIQKAKKLQHETEGEETSRPDSGKTRE